MPDSTTGDLGDRAALPDGPRAILRVPDVLLAVAARREGRSFAELREVLGLPKSSLHRLLRTLEQGGYLVQRSGMYFLGPASVTLARELGKALPADDLPDAARPVLEWLARETGESIILAELADNGDEVFYIDVINSEAPLRFTVPLGNKRPLYAAASGQAILAFLPREEQERYLAQARFEELTGSTIDRDRLREKLPAIAESAFVFDRNGSFAGASGIASPCFDHSGKLRCAVSVAGPTERIERAMDRLQSILLEAAERISRNLSYAGTYPPRS